MSVVADEATCEGNAEKTIAIWGSFADVLEAMPIQQTFDVLAGWSA